MIKLKELLRSFPHSNSKRELEERAKDDEQEALEYTTNFVANHHSKDEYPDVYSDVWIESKIKKYKTKPKQHHHKGAKSIRKEVPDENY